MNQRSERGEHPLVSLSKQGGEDVLADALAPEVIAAVTAGEAGSVEVYPMGLAAAGNPVAARRDPVALQLQAALQTAELHPAGGSKIDLDFHTQIYAESNATSSRVCLAYLSVH